MRYWLLPLLIIFLLLGCSRSDSKLEENQTLEVFQGTPLKLIKINTRGKTIEDEPKISASLKIEANQEILEEHLIGIEIRGSSSQMFEKKSYGFETWNENNEDLNTELAGFPEEEDWILYGPYSDKTLMRNVLIYQLSNQMGRYASRTDFYELEINNVFMGTYVLMEKIKRDKNRVDISKNKEEDISGGYILKIDKTTGDGGILNKDIAFGSQYSPRGELESYKNTSFLYQYPKSDDINDSQKEYIQNYINDFETALFSNEFTSAENGYQKFIDIDTFIDFFILNELSKNPDGYRISTYMHKDKGEKLKMGPIWDFNIAYGNVDYCDGASTVGWAYQFNNVCPNDSMQVPFWWNRFLEDPEFVILLQTRWTELRNNILATQTILSQVEILQKTLNSSNASDKNFSKWLVLGKYIWPNAFVGDSYSSEINYLKDWILNRMDWLDTNIDLL
jgi:spore coat protein CotH